VAHEHCERVIELNVRVGKLEEWGEKQNGSLQRINEKLDKSKLWIMSLMGGMIVSLILLLINMGLGR
jgi:hypothetical protein